MLPSKLFDMEVPPIMSIFSFARTLIIVTASCLLATACGGGAGNGSTGTGSAAADAPSVTGPTGTSSYGAGSYNGFGSNVTGGTGGTVVTVTNLNDNGPGSFRDAVSGSNRIVQFAVSGTINLTSIVYLSGPNVTVDGFSAPVPGITLTGASIQVGGEAYGGPTSKGSNIIVRGLRIRNSTDKSILVSYNAHDVVLDHLSMSGAIDEEMALTEGSYNITVQYCIIGPNSSVGPGGTLLSYDTSQVSMHHNIWYGNKDRNPIITGDFTRNYSSGSNYTAVNADIRYNIMWDYGIGTYVISNGGAVATANVVANLYRNNGSTNPSDVIVRAAYGSSQRGNAYIAGNITAHDPRGCAFSYNTTPCYNFQTTNSQSNVSEYTAPPISGPTITDQQGLLNEWQAVKNSAGLISKFADDAVDSQTRNAITIPDISIFSAVWNN